MSHETPHQQTHRTTHQVLVVDDEALLCWTMHRILVDCGLQTTCRRTVAGAMLALEQERFDLVITDLRLPDGSGIAIARAAYEKDASTAVLLLSADPDLDPADVSAFGVRELIRKPFDIDTLLRSILGHLERSPGIAPVHGNQSPPPLIPSPILPRSSS